MHGFIHWLQRLLQDDEGKRSVSRGIQFLMMGFVSFVFLFIISIIVLWQGRAENYKWLKHHVDGSKIKIEADGLNENFVSIYWSTDFVKQTLVYENGAQFEDDLWEYGNNCFNVSVG